MEVWAKDESYERKTYLISSALIQYLDLFSVSLLRRSGNASSRGAMEPPVLRTSLDTRGLSLEILYQEVRTAWFV